MDLIDLTQNNDRWRAFSDTVKNFRVPQKIRAFLDRLRNYKLHKMDLAACS